MTKRNLLLAGALAAMVATAGQAGPDRNLGVTVRANIAAQVIDPDPDYSNMPLPGTSGRRAADAMIRYQTGKLKPLLKTNGKADGFGQGAQGEEPTVSIPLISSGTPN